MTTSSNNSATTRHQAALKQFSAASVKAILAMLHSCTTGVALRRAERAQEQAHEALLASGRNLEGSRVNVLSACLSANEIALTEARTAHYANNESYKAIAELYFVARQNAYDAYVADKQASSKHESAWGKRVEYKELVEEIKREIEAERQQDCLQAGLPEHTEDLVSRTEGVSWMQIIAAIESARPSGAPRPLTPAEWEPVIDIGAELLIDRSASMDEGEHIFEFACFAEPPVPPNASELALNRLMDYYGHPGNTRNQQAADEAAEEARPTDMSDQIGSLPANYRND